MVDVLIIGGGPSGLTAAIYALRGGAKVLLIEKAFIGGQTARLVDIANFPSYEKVNGFDLTQSMFNQATKLGLETLYAQVENIEKTTDGFVVRHSKGEQSAKAVIIATGAERIGLGIEQGFVGRGVSYCATCDGMFFKEKIVALVGVGKRAKEECEYLCRVAKKVYFIFGGAQNEKSTAFFSSLPQNAQVLYGVRPVELVGQKSLEKVILDSSEGRQELTVDGLFISMGSTPLVGLVANLLATKSDGIVTDDEMKTSCEGIFACGDCIVSKMKQIVSACADGAKAAESALEYIGQA